MGSEEDKLKSFYTLKALSNKGYTIIFPTVIYYDTSKTLGEVYDSILGFKNSIFKMYKIEPSAFNTAAALLSKLKTTFDSLPNLSVVVTYFFLTLLILFKIATEFLLNQYHFKFNFF